MAMSNVVSMKFRQIDFLRLFRLCKSIGLVARKRKMPSEYSKDGECKNACKRLLTLVVKEVFKDHTLRPGYSSVQVYTPSETSSQLREIAQQVLYPDYYRNRLIAMPGEVRERVIALQNFDNFGNGHISLSFPSSIAFNYRSYATNIAKDSFYHCALDCIAFKTYWDEQVTSILEIYKEAQRVAQNLANDRQELEKRTREQQQSLQQRVVEHQQQQPVNQQIIEQQQIVEQQQMVEQQRQQQLESQRRFNEALSGWYLARTNTNGGV